MNQRDRYSSYRLERDQHALCIIGKWETLPDLSLIQPLVTTWVHCQLGYKVTEQAYWSTFFTSPSGTLMAVKRRNFQTPTPI